ncbi:MAG: 1,4-alpha-glucan branching protein GlgB [Candidatus Nanopelagicales bacterium]
MTVHKGVIDAILDGRHFDPHSFLGAHLESGTVFFRVIQPFALSVLVIGKDFRVPMEHLHRGVWEGQLQVSSIPNYRIEARYGEETIVRDDSFRHLPTVGELDLHLIHEGRHEQLTNALGARVLSFQSELGVVSGTAFTVWAPNAKGIQVVGDFNHWDGTSHPMRSLGVSGVWEIFIPDVKKGDTYKFRVTTAAGYQIDKADPLARHSEVPPSTASIVWESSYQWNDDNWLDSRSETDWKSAPISVYEVHFGSWRQGISFSQAAIELRDYVLLHGFTHVEFLPLAQHPFAPSWGYQVTGYFAVASRYGNPDELKYLIDVLHQAGIGVIMDWVPAHFPKDAWALARFDGTPLYEHPNPQLGEHPDWGTYIFNYGRAEVKNFLVANALFWLEEFHIDGLRVDAVASMLYLDYSREDGQWQANIYGGRENLEAVEFLKELNGVIHLRAPGTLTMAEESTSWPGVTTSLEYGGLGFDFKWNMGWMHDSLEYVKHEPIHRKFHHNEMTFSLVYAWSERFILPLSHDEVVHGKGSLINRMPGNRWQQLAGLRSYLGFMWGHPGKKLLFMGSEFAQSNEWNASSSLDWWLTDFPEHQAMARFIQNLNHAYKEHSALWQRDGEPGGFEWLVSDDADANVFAWVRNDFDGSMVACISNLSPVHRPDYRLALPKAGIWKEILNSDALDYGGSGEGNLGQVIAEEIPLYARNASAKINLGPLSTMWLTCIPN